MKWKKKTEVINGVETPVLDLEAVSTNIQKLSDCLKTTRLNPQGIKGAAEIVRLLKAKAKDDAQWNALQVAILKHVVKNREGVGDVFRGAGIGRGLLQYYLETEQFEDFSAYQEYIKSMLAKHMLPEEAELVLSDLDAQDGHGWHMFVTASSQYSKKKEPPYQLHELKGYDGSRLESLGLALAIAANDLSTSVVSSTQELIYSIPPERHDTLINIYRLVGQAPQELIYSIPPERHDTLINIYRLVGQAPQLFVSDSIEKLLPEKGGKVFFELLTNSKKFNELVSKFKSKVRDAWVRHLLDSETTEAPELPRLAELVLGSEDMNGIVDKVHHYQRQKLKCTGFKYKSDPTTLESLVEVTSYLTAQSQYSKPQGLLPLWGQTLSSFNHSFTTKRFFGGLEGLVLGDEARWCEQAKLYTNEMTSQRALRN